MQPTLDTLRKEASLRNTLADAAMGVAGKAKGAVTGALNNRSSRARVILDRILPNLDEAATGTEGYAALANPLGDEAGQLLAAGLTAHVGAAGGTKAMALGHAVNSLSSLKGLASGATTGAVTGGATAVDLDDPGNTSMASVLKRMAVGALGGGAAGMGGNAVVRGVAGAGKYYRGRMNAQLGLLNKGLMPSAVYANEGPLDKTKSFGGLRDLVSDMVADQRKNNGQRVMMLQNTGQDSGAFMRELQGALKNAGTREMDAGNMINARMPDFLTPLFAKSMGKKLGFKRIYGAFDSKNIAETAARQQSFIDGTVMGGLEDSGLINGAVAHTARKRTSGIKGLFEDLRAGNREANVFGAAKTQRDASSQFSDVTAAIDKKYTDAELDTFGLTRPQLHDFIDKRLGGIQKSDRIFTDGTGKVPFDIGIDGLKLKDNVTGAAIPRKSKHLVDLNYTTMDDQGGDILRRRMAEAGFDREGLDHAWSSSFGKGEESALKKLRQRAALDNKLDVTGGIEDITGFGRDGLKSMFPGKSIREAEAAAIKAKAKAAALAKAEAAKAKASPLKDLAGASKVDEAKLAARKAQLAADVKATNELKGGISVRDIKRQDPTAWAEEINNLRKSKGEGWTDTDMFPSWAAAKNGDGLIDADSLELLGINNAADWKAFVTQAKAAL